MANKHNINRTGQPNGEAGFASIVIAMVLIVVLALMTVGFATLARREQQNALDKQLANQAYDAAESGVNDAYSDILNNYITTSTPNEGTDNCIDPSKLPAGSQVGGSNGTIDGYHGVSYTCLMVNLTPPTLTQALTAGTAWTTVFSTTGSNALNSFDVIWNSNDGQYDNPPSGTTFPPIGSATDGSQWGTAPAVLQLSITPLSTVDRSSLMSNTETFYFRPVASGGGTVTVGSTASGSIISAACSTVSTEISKATGKPGACGQVKVTVNGLSGSAGEYYLVHVIDYYDYSQVYLGNARDGSGNALNFGNSQAVIDVTGKARQVLKRLQVYKPLYQPQLTSNYGVEAQDICKRFSTDPVAGTVQQSNGITDPDKACSLTN